MCDVFCYFHILYFIGVLLGYKAEFTLNVFVIAVIRMTVACYHNIGFVAYLPYDRAPLKAPDS